jgi:C4-dicarboxylate transporter DctQ subunit
VKGTPMRLEVIKTASVMQKIIATLGVFQDYVSMVCFVLMGIFVLTSVFMRFVIQVPFSWGEEISRYLMVVGIMLGIGLGVKENTHLGVTMFVEAMPHKVCKILKLFTFIINIFAYGLLTYVSFMFMISNYHFAQRSPALDIPMWWMYGIVALGFLLSMMESINALMLFIKRKQPDEKDDENDSVIFAS